MKTFVGLFGLGLLVLALLAGYSWGIEHATGWAALVQPVITHRVRPVVMDGLAVASFVYAIGAMTLVFKALEGTLRGASLLCLALGATGLMIAFGWFVLWTGDGGMMGPAPMFLCMGVLGALIPGTLFVMSGVFSLAFAGWYAEDARKALRNATRPLA